MIENELIRLNCNIMKLKDNKMLKRIANHLIINASFMENIGLYHGKMGIILFLFHYARYTNNSIYNDFAGELLDEICNEINDRLNIDFENGLCGIGWGILYLIDHDFIEGEVNDILEDFDKEIMKWNLRYITDESIETGITGINFYIQYRIYMSKGEPYFDNDYISSYNIRCGSIKDHLFDLSMIVDDTYVDELSNPINEWKLGLKKGCSGFGLKVLLS